jgi:GAF domain-containing protein
MRLPASAGIAGWVLVTRQPLAVDDVASDERFSRSAAESTGYVPNALMAAPLVDEDTVLGVLSVLDPPEGTRFGIAEIELLGLFAHQAAIALSLLLQARRARAARADDDSPAAVATRVAAALAGREDDAGRRLLRALEDILEAP